jgi:hypothetical protein
VNRQALQPAHCRIVVSPKHHRFNGYESSAKILAAEMKKLIWLAAGIVMMGLLNHLAWAGPVAAGTGIPEDWSHRHLVFSRPASVRQQQRLEFDTRYRMQQARRSVESSSDSALLFDSKALGIARSWAVQVSGVKGGLKGLWSVNLGTGASVGNGMYPAKFSFGVGSGSCAGAAAPDFVVFNTGEPGASDKEPAQTGAFADGETPAGSVTITNKATGELITLTASATSNNGTNFLADNSGERDAANLAAAIVRNGAKVGVTAVSHGAMIAVIGDKAGTAGTSITLAKSLTAFSWAGGALNGNTSGATVVAYDNLYSGCAGTVPTLYWAYNTGDGSIAPASVVFSGDGSQIAFVQNSSSGVAHLIILKWKPSTELTTLPNTAPGSYRGCTAPCMTALTFLGSRRDSNSSPFYDYDQDLLYVGDDAGNLHKFSNIFISGTPAEVATGWPIAVSAGASAQLTGPVFDSNARGTGSGNIFVADASGTLSYVRDNVRSSGSCKAPATPPCLGTPSISLGGSVVDGPLLDGSTERVFWFDGTDPVNFGEVVQTNTALGEQRTLAVGGGSGTISNMHIGDFDNTYYESASNDIEGYLYVCGKYNIYVDRPALYRVGFNSSGLMNTSKAGGPLTLAASPGFVECSPVTEVFNAGTDRIFLSVQDLNGLSACNAVCNKGACVYSFDITGSFPSSAAACLSSAGGTSGIIIDNTAASPAGASQIYFSTLEDQQCSIGGMGGCATQASQAGLQ